MFAGKLLEFKEILQTRVKEVFKKDLLEAKEISDKLEKPAFLLLEMELLKNLTHTGSFKIGIVHEGLKSKELFNEFEKKIANHEWKDFVVSLVKVNYGYIAELKRTIMVYEMEFHFL